MIELRPRILGFTPALEAPVHVLGLQGASVVIVDDQETARFLLDEMIRGIDPGIETSLFASGIEALATSRAAPFVGGGPGTERCPADGAGRAGNGRLRQIVRYHQLRRRCAGTRGCRPAVHYRS